MNTNHISDYGKIPPQNIEIEESLLGALMSFPNAIDTVSPLLTIDDFYKESHQLIYTAICDLYSGNRKIDILTVSEQLRKNGNLDKVGGPFYVTQLTGRAMHEHHVEAHATIIKDKGIKRSLIQYGSELEVMGYDDSIDVKDVLDHSQTGLNRITEQVFGAAKRIFKDVINETLNKYYEAKEKAKTGQYTGVKTPIFALTDITGGWQPSDLIIVAARPSMGKTAFAVQVATTALTAGHNVDLYTLEMSDMQLTQRAICCKSGLNPEKIRNGKLTEHEEKLLEDTAYAISDYKINLDDKSGITAEYVKAKSSSHHRKGNCDLIIVDYLQIMSYSEKLSKNDGVGSITRKLKSLAKELNVPVMVLSQLNRNVESRGGMKRPNLGDLRDSGEIEQDADVVIFIHRPEYYGINEYEDGRSTAGVTEIIIEKHRNGRVGIVDARNNETITQFFDADVRQDEFINQTIPEF